MPSIPKLRRTWFALVREAGIDPEDRHAVQEELTGKPSVRDWTPADYDRAIAQLQRDLGRHNDHRAHVRNDGAPERAADAPATDGQARYIADLCDQVHWRVGPVAYLCRTVLAGPDNAGRRDQLRRAVARGDTGPRLWATLTRREASDAIKALDKAAHVYPQETARA